MAATAGIATAATVVALVCTARLSHVSSITHALGHRQSRLTFTPQRLRALDVLIIALVAVCKSILSLFGLTPRLVPSADGSGFELPLVEISAPLEVAEIDIIRYRNALAAFSTSAKNAGQDDDPLALLLVALTNPLMMLTLANFHTPIAPLGSVNTRNRFEFLVRDPKNFVGSTLEATAQLGGRHWLGRRTRRGIEFDITIEVSASGILSRDQPKDAAPSARTILRQCITIMQKLPKKTCLPAAKPNAEPAVLLTNASSVATHPVHIPYRAPSAWAELCKDYNPIHVSAWAAQLFGFPGRMAHGNHVACQALSIVLQDPNFHGRRLDAVEVAFKRPMILPMDLVLAHQARGDDSVAFEFSWGDKVHVEGNAKFE